MRINQGGLDLISGPLERRSKARDWKPADLGEGTHGAFYSCMKTNSENSHAGLEQNPAPQMRLRVQFICNPVR